MSTQTQRIAVLTGATGVIGKEIARGLAQAGFSVVLPSRSISKGQKLIAELTADLAKSSIKPKFALEQVDLDSKASIQALAQRLLIKFPRIDVLINNAAVAPTEREVTNDGIEISFAVNVLSYHWLSQLLRPALKAASTPNHQARIVNVASRYAGLLDLDDLELAKKPFDGHVAYKRSKAANRLLSWEAARQYRQDGIAVNAVYPGYTASDLSAGLNMAKAAPDTPEESAAGPIRLAVDPTLEGVTGTYFEKTAIHQCQWANDIETQQKLWKIVELY